MPYDEDKQIVEESNYHESKVFGALSHENQNVILSFLDSREMSKSATLGEIKICFDFTTSQQMLSQIVRQLIDIGLVTRNEFHGYSITLRGKNCVSTIRKLEDELN